MRSDRKTSILLNHDEIPVFLVVMQVVLQGVRLVLVDVFGELGEELLALLGIDKLVALN